MKDSAHSPTDTRGVPYVRGDETIVKLLVAGSFGVGKTTFIGTLSETSPLLTEETMTEASVASDSLKGIPNKTSTTVAMDFGRLTLNDSLLLYLFGSPGQERFFFTVPDLARGAIGALILVDTRRLDESFPFLDLMGDLVLPYAVAVNQFDGAIPHHTDDIRAALALSEDTPLILCDARVRKSARTALITVVEHALTFSEPA